MTVLTNLKQKLFSFDTLCWGLFLLLVHAFRFLSLPENGIDPSWRIAINLAHQQNLQFGEDFIFTYGPLGYLESGLPDHVSVITLILFRLFLIGNAIWFILQVQRKLNDQFRFFLLLAVFVFFNFLFSNQVDFQLYFFFLFHLFSYLKERKLVSLFFVLVITVLSFYIKVSTGIILNVLLLASLFYLAITRLMKWPHLLIGISAVAVLHLLLSLILPINTGSYIKNGLDLINYYNDVMFFGPPPYVVLSALAVIGLMLFLFLANPLPVLKSKQELFLFGHAFAFLFVVFKQSFVRPDMIHIPVFFSSAICLLLLLYLFTNIEKTRSYALNAFPLLLLLCCLPEIGRANFFNNVGNHIKQLVRYNTEAARNFDEQKGGLGLPQGMIDSIGKGTVDVIPSEISFVYYNRLSYQPRPAIQSYAAYTPKLIMANYDAYLSAKAPEFVIYHPNQLQENRHPFWDDMHTQLALLQNYHMIDSVTIPGKELLLFKKNSVAKQLHKKLLLDTVLELNKKITIPQTDKLLFMECDFAYTMPGKLRRFFYQPPAIYLQLQVNDTTSYNVKALFPIVKTGVLLNKSLLKDKGALDFNKVRTFFSNSDSSFSDVKAIEFNGNSKMVKHSFRVKFWEYSL
ncbi:hypothetical protein [Lacibacter sediminis]|uniref:Uncharacterized protein n=1 Tax=Lacibacter sediminis TaxID=2760713 RepID=A0A7G5XHP5_9BACT|nr:hypothetical protein [Lacibacter sediminis]QNA44998.1 hypothetical protein H4075_02045 [Lacibacter sediminis]